MYDGANIFSNLFCISFLGFLQLLLSSDCCTTDEVRIIILCTLYSNELANGYWQANRTHLTYSEYYDTYRIEDTTSG